MPSIRIFLYTLIAGNCQIIENRQNYFALWLRARMIGPFLGPAATSFSALSQTDAFGEKARQPRSKRGNSFPYGQPPRPCDYWVKRKAFWKSWGASRSVPVFGEGSFTMRELLQSAWPTARTSFSPGIATSPCSPNSQRATHLQTRSRHSPHYVPIRLKCRPCRGCTGRLFGPPCSSRKTFSCDSHIGSGSVITYQSTDSSHGGVVLEPS